MKTILPVLLLIVPLSAAAEPVSTNYWAVKWVASSFATPTLPHFRFAVEKRWYDRAINAQAGVSLPGIELTNPNINSRGGYAGRLEWRSYFNKKKRSLSLYHGIEGFYYYSHGDAVDEFATENTTTSYPFAPEDYYKDEYQYRRNVFGIVYKFGFQFCIKTHFIFELSTGAGLKYIDNKSFNRDNINDRVKPDPDFFKTTTYNNYHHFVPAIPCLVAIGYRL